VPFDLATPAGSERAIDIRLHLRLGQMIDLFVQLLRERGRRGAHISGGGEPATAVSALRDVVRAMHEAVRRQPAGVESLDLVISEMGRWQVNVSHKRKRSYRGAY
jgi:hypothetical protein